MHPGGESVFYEEEVSTQYLSTALHTWDGTAVEIRWQGRLELLLISIVYLSPLFLALIGSRRCHRNILVSQLEHKGMEREIGLVTERNGMWSLGSSWQRRTERKLPYIKTPSPRNLLRPPLSSSLKRSSSSRSSPQATIPTSKDRYH